MDVTFLYAPQKLVKTITQTADGKIHKSQYPLAKHFTSHTVEINTLVDLHKSIASHAVDPRKPCALKGRIAREITDESRRNSTSTADRTQWVVLDPDEAPFTSAEEMMRALKLQDVSYIVQYSSSHKLTQSKKLSAHIFIMLDAPVPAPTLKSWLMQLNLETPALRNALSLSNSKAALKWPLDITSCQNDRLIYIAEPEFKGMKSPIKTSERIQYVKKQRERLDISRITEKPIDALKKEARIELNRLQDAAGITPNKKASRMNGEHLVQYGAIEASDWEVVDDDGEFVRLNLNGGDSAAYWHYRNDFELLHNFKGEDSLKMKEVLPNYYKELVSRQKEENARIRAERSTPAKSEEGDTILCFREKQTGSYWNGTYNAGLNKLDLFPAKNERQCDHFLASHGQPPLDYIPVWQRIFNPTTDKIVDPDELTINMWSPSELMKNHAKIKDPERKGFPIIQRIIDSAVGTGPIQEHFLNWLAVIAQHRTKPRTAWILHGTQGTGKGLLIHKVIAKILGPKYVVTRMQNELRSDFTGFVEFALVVFIDEISVNSLDAGGELEEKLKYQITEPIVPIRKMRTDTYEVPSYTGWIFGSNKNQPVTIPRNDRRYNVGTFQRAPLKITEGEVENGITRELQTFTDYIMSRKADKAVAAVPLQTEDRDQIMELSETSLDQTANAINYGRLEDMWDAMPDEKMWAAIAHSSSTPVETYTFVNVMRRSVKDCYENKVTRISRDELGHIFEYCVGGAPKSPNKLTRYLSHHGVKTKRIRVEGSERFYGIEVKWEASTEFLNSVYKPAKPQPRPRGERALRVVEGNKRKSS